ncbi:hypothetical protein [Variovorax paradoxus]|jgi:hypothetical protein|uniref:hypothetical protein n=1 Tax=Variovorax paradoxus TaxID=34073 RepID=UPI000A5D3502
MNPDELGEKGESRFKELCADAGLICNKSDRDRAGWDFIVEDQFSLSSSLPFDRRKSPISCHVQVKTIHAKAKSVRIKLNMAERLAKELKPAFVCILTVNDAKEVVGLHLLHILDDRLSAILKRLRQQAAAQNTRALNKSVLSMSPISEDLVPVTGAALRAALENAIGLDLYKYAQRKQVQLAELGVESVIANVELRFQKGANKARELSDILLGLSAGAGSFRILENRFGIEWPVMDAAIGKFEFTPVASDSCRVVVRSKETPAVGMDGKVFRIPALFHGADDRTRLDCEFVKIDFFWNFESLNGKLTLSPTNFSTTVLGWMNYWRVTRALCSTGAIIEIRTERGQIPLRLPFEKPLGISAAAVDRWIALTDAYREIFVACGEEPSHHYGCAEIAAQESKLVLAKVLLEDPDRKFSFEIPLDAASGGSGSLPSTAILVDMIEVGPVSLAYHVLASIDSRIEGDNIEVEISNFVFRGGRKIGSDAGDLEAYKRGAQNEENLTLCFGFDMEGWFIS